MIWIALVLASLLSVCGQLCQSRRPARSPFVRENATLRNGLGLLWQASALTMLLWLAVLQNIPVGIAYPMLSLNFVWVTLAAWRIWREPVTTRHWLGLG